MSYQEPDWEREWQGLEPKQPRNIRWGCWLGVALVTVLLAACVWGGMLLWRELSEPTGILPLLGTPTPLAPAPDDAGEGEGGAELTTPALAPTVTLPSASVESEVAAVALATPPAIDGDLGEWADVPVYGSSFLVYSNDAWDGTEDVTAQWRLGWDSNNLYVGAQVIDDVHVQTQVGEQIFRGDSLSLQFDTDRAGDLGPQLSPDDYQIDLSPGSFTGVPPASFRYRGTTGGSMTNAPGAEVAIAAQQTGDGYFLEAAIPWEAIDVQPVPGIVLGLALNVSDNDTPGEAIQEIMKSHVATRTFGDPTSWGTLVLR